MASDGSIQTPRLACLFLLGCHLVGGSWMTKEFLGDGGDGRRLRVLQPYRFEEKRTVDLVSTFPTGF